MVDLSVVIPLFNGRNHIDSLLADLIPVLEALDRTWEIFFVDDHSRDNSFDVLKKWHKKDNRIRGCRLKENRGQQNALFCGLLSCKGSMVLTMDDDGQHPSKRIPEMIELLEKGAEAVYMVRNSGHRPWILRLGTGLTDLFFTVFLRKPHKIKIGSFRILQRELISRFSEEALHRSSDGFVYISALIFQCRPRPKIETLYYDPAEGESNGNSRFSLKSRIILFCRLFYNYGPLSFLSRSRGIGRKELFEREEII